MYTSSSCAAQSIGPANGKYLKERKQTVQKVHIFDLISINRIVWNINSNNISRSMCNFITRPLAKRLWTCIQKWYQFYFSIFFHYQRSVFYFENLVE